MWYNLVKGDSKMKKHIVKLTKEERKGLREVVKTGKTQAYKITHARILLKVDSGKYGEHYEDIGSIRTTLYSEAWNLAKYSGDRV